ncbi:uncharacterized protein J3R85_000593 [Psidium guajava]|nr:uncharacterized protein J3R85_000593 [Psidium guajava]
MDQPRQERPGVVGSVLRAVHDPYELVKEVVVGKSHDAAETTREDAEYTADRSCGGYDAAMCKAKEYKDYTAENAKETTNPAAQKVKEKEKTREAAENAKETEESAKGKLGEYKDSTAQRAKKAKEKTKQKATEYKDYTALKPRKPKRRRRRRQASEGREGHNGGELGEPKESAADVARQAMEMLSGKKEETKEKTYETVESAKEIETLILVNFSGEPEGDKGGSEEEDGRDEGEGESTRLTRHAGPGRTRRLGKRKETMSS